MLPDHYPMPRVGEFDPVGYSTPLTGFCGYKLRDPVGCSPWVCTLPPTHHVPFHVAHGSKGKVLGTDDPDLHLPEGL